MITKTAIKALRIGSRDGDTGVVGDHSGRSEDPAGQEESDDALGVLGKGTRQSGGSKMGTSLASLRRASPCPDGGALSSRLVPAARQRQTSGG